MDGLEEKEDLKIKDLLIKLQILAQGLIEERKKTSIYLEKIKNYEELLQKKDQSITDLNKDKFDLQAKLSLERSKNGPKKKSGKIGNFVGNFFSDNQNNGKITQLEQETNKLKYEKKNLLQSLAEDKEKFEQEQMKLQTSIALQTTKINQLEKEKEDLREELRNLAMQRESVNKMIQDFEDNKYKYDEEYKKFKLENEEYIKQATDSLIRLEEKNKECFQKEKALKDLKKERDDLINKLYEMKKEMKNQKIRKIDFKVEKVEGILSHNKQMTITFNKDEKTNKFEMIIKYDNNKEEKINIMNINDFKKSNEKDKNKFDINYVSNGKNVKLVVKIHELLADFFFQTYRDFFQVANEAQY